MKIRILALLALCVFASGCTPISTTSTGSTQAGSADPGLPATAATESPTQDTRTTANRDVAVSVTDEPGSDLDNDVREDTGAQAPDTFPTSDPTADKDTSASKSALVLREAELERARLETEKQSVISLCEEIGNKLGSVSVTDCLAQPLEFAGAYTVQSRPIVTRDFGPSAANGDQPKILIMGGIHGDEYSSISIMFRWMELLDSSNNRDFHWRFAPTVNPDGLLDGQAVRQNANGVDLNRNFPSKDWLDLAEDYWNTITNRNPRRYPGTHPASEPEVQWVVDQIESFRPNVIVSVHAPYHLLDYDGPPEAPEQIGELHLHLLGVYPGSLGNYAGINLGIPVVTMELPSAGIMPSDEQIVSMWNDLLEWLYEHHNS